MASIAAYLIDAIVRAGIQPWLVLGVTGVLLAAAARSWRIERSGGADAVVWGGIVLFLLAAILRLSWPALLPPGRGPDLTHHLLLADYLERHGALVHDRTLHSVMGEMAHYTPGAHLLAVLAGRWSGAGALGAFFPLLAGCAALTGGWVYLIARRMAVPAPYALVAVLLLLLPSSYFFGAFTHDSFLAQTVSTLFAAALWWALVAWDQEPSSGWLLVIAVLLPAVFLAWPIWLGPLLLLFIARLRREPRGSREWLRSFALAIAPLAIVVVTHTLGRLGWTVIVRTSGAVLPPDLETMGWFFPLLGAIGVLAGARQPRARITVAFLVLIGVQAFTLFVIAKAQGADTPYMAFKMIYLAIYPAAVLGAAAIARTETMGWLLAAILMVTAALPALTAPRAVPVVDANLHEAGRWLRMNVGQACADYIVADAETAYWLHLAVLGNSRTSARMADVDRYDPRTAAGPWIAGTGRPYAIADLRLLPGEVRSRVEIAARFGDAAVIKRPDAQGCAE